MGFNERERYTDVSVVCGPYQADAQDKNTIVNPDLVVEVTSESTEEYDRGENSRATSASRL